MKADNGLKIETKKHVKVYYEYDPSRKYPYRLFERESFLDSWSEVGNFKTLDAAQEAGLSRAITVTDMGLFERGHRKGMMSWWEEPKPQPKHIPQLSANFEYSEEVEVEKKFLRKEIRK